jgi:hypothetical protein
MDEVRATPDWGVVRGVVKGTLSEKPDGDPVPLRDRFLAIVEKDAAGKWRFSRLMWGPLAK